MEYINLEGTWFNEFGSTMEITSVNPDTGMFVGIYKSHTGATGVYHLTGITDVKPDPKVNSQTVAFAISWRNIESSGDDDGSNWVSAFSGQVQIVDGNQLKMTTTYLFQKDTNPSDNWGSTIVDKATFTRQ
jgi:Avidin family